ncbi:monooxygenase [Georgenia subflava]|uniref:Monooxygenase n=1 Tax=Georgenia subflava TaxID=1622177 RepID=A0A6N7EL00_9MICO|nr:monooxygenase [Georgenia subflava]
MDVDVLVVGAGPTGLTLAAELARNGTSFRVVDRNLDRAHESRALAIQPRTLEVLATLGLSEDLLEHGNAATLLRMHFGRRTVPVRLFDLGLDDTAFPFLLFLSQAETERILVNHLAARGAQIQRGVELTGLRDEAGAVVCGVRSPGGREETVRARYVVGCDGAHSTVRHAARIDFRGAAYPQTFVLSDLEADGIDPGSAHVFVSGRGMLFFFPLGTPATWRLLAMRPRADTTPVERPVTLAEVQALTDAYATGVRVHDPVWMTNFQLHNRGAARYRSGRVFLAGDAAHIHSPAGAQGMNTGIQDAINLGWKLSLVAAGIAAPRLLDTYEPERAPVGRSVLRFTDRAFTIATSTAAPLRVARTWLAPRVIPLALRMRPGRATAFRTVTELRIRYRRSPLSVEGPGAPRRGPRAGDRLPDAPLTTPAGKPSTLHALLATPGFHLLLCGPPRAWTEGTTTMLAEHYASLSVHCLSPQPTSGVLHDPTGVVLDRLGIASRSTAHLLVRPDGHIAYRGGRDLRGLHAYLATWIGWPEVTSPAPSQTT